MNEIGTFTLCFGCQLGHQVGDGFQLQPPLLTRALVFQIGHAVEVAHIVKDKFSVLQADEAAGGVILAALLDQMLEAEGC